MVAQHGEGIANVLFCEAFQNLTFYLLSFLRQMHDIPRRVGLANKKSESQGF